uniref:Hsp20/alpha crystallin family protein n=1 Tax=Schlesneria paludicola TaxID=360056 RepID=A0A7C2NW22_9PLAN
MLSTVTNRWGTLLSDPFEAVRREFARDLGFGGSGNGIGQESRRYGALSLWEDDEKVYIEIDVPGLQLEDLNLTMEGGQLWIRGERRMAQHDEKCWYDERFYGGFQRAVSLQDTVDPNSIDASLSDGVLSITLTKKPEYQPHRVTVKYAGGPKKEKRLSQNN